MFAEPERILLHTRSAASHAAGSAPQALYAPVCTA
jgi:hypothetical protein